MTEALSPTDEIARIERQGRIQHTPCLDGQLTWHVWGNGPPLVLFHGGHGSWLHWIRSIEILARHYTVLAVDYPGHGTSSMPAMPFTAESLAGHLRDGIVHLLGATQRFKMLCFSFGTIMGGVTATLLPGRIDRLVLVAAAALGVRRGSMAAMVPWRHITDADELVRIHTHNLKVLMIDDAARMDALAVHIHHVNMMRTAIRTRWISQTTTLRDALPKIDAPIACIWGKHDVLVGPWIDERLALMRSIQPDMPLVVLPRGGHWVQYEEPELFHPVALEMLAD